MKKSGLLLILFFFSCLMIYAQFPQLKWVKEIPRILDNSLDDFDVACDSAGKHIFIGGGGLAKCNAGGDTIWSFIFPGSTRCNALSADSSGNVYVVGKFGNMVDFDPGPNTALLTSSGYDIFVAKYDALGKYVWAYKIAGEDPAGGQVATKNDYPGTIVRDGSGNIYITGRFEGRADFDPEPYSTFLTSHRFTYRYYVSAFIAKYTSDGKLVWVRNLGQGIYNAKNMTLDPKANIYVSGQIDSISDIDPGPGVVNVSGKYIAKFDSSGNYVWSFKGISGEITSDEDGNVYVATNAPSTADFDPGPKEVYLFKDSGPAIAKYSPSGAYEWGFRLRTINGSLPEIRSITNYSNYIYITGGIFGPVDFNPKSDTALLSGSNYGGVFVAKYDTSTNYKWGFSYAGIGYNFHYDDEQMGYSVKTDNKNNFYLCGGLYNKVDFDPGLIRITSPQ